MQNVVIACSDISNLFNVSLENDLRNVWTTQDEFNRLKKHKMSL